MKRKWLWLVAFSLASTLMLATVGHGPVQNTSLQSVSFLAQSAQAQSAQAQSPSPATASPTSNPAESPAPAEAPAAPAPAAPAPAEATDESADLERYTDPGERFEVAILPDYAVNATAGISLIESPEGDLAYAVVVKQRATDAALGEAALTQITIETFQDGEGFQPGEVTKADTGIQLAWTGSLTLGKAPPQPVSGTILTRQADRNVLMLVVSATGAGTEKLDAAIAQLSATFKPL